MKKEEFTIRIAGEAGQGMATIGDTLGKIFIRAGFDVFSIQDYMSRIRGGNNFYQLRVAARAVTTARERYDLLLPLDKTSADLHGGDCAPDAFLVYDAERFGPPPARFGAGQADGVIECPLYAIATQIGGHERYASSVATGFISGFLGVGPDITEKAVGESFAHKEESVVAGNLACARAGHERGVAAVHSRGVVFARGAYRPGGSTMNGNDALALGAIRAGLKFYAAYPMTPSTSILDNVVANAARYGIVVEQAEDEIAAINMAIGASFAGVRSMTGTSGGGFALMTESLSLAGMTETPLVVVDAQRPGPATGFPTRTEQGDLDFVIHAGHGDFARAVFAPGSIEECYLLAVRAFNIADRFQIPVIIMTDQYLADSKRNLALPVDAAEPVVSYRLERSTTSAAERYLRYRLTPDGISKRAVPSWTGNPFWVDSDEHDETGHITESAATRVAMTEKRYLKRMEALRAVVVPPTVYGSPEAHNVLVGFGSTLHLMREACDAIGTNRVGFVHCSQVWPFPARAVADALAGRKVIDVENNASGQFAGLLMRETGNAVSDRILKYDGRPFTLDGLVRETERRMAV